MTAFTPKDGLLDREFDDPAIQQIYRSIAREIGRQREIVARLSAPVLHSVTASPHEERPCKPR